MLAPVLAHSAMLFFAAALALSGWYMAHHPDRALRFFMLGKEPVFWKKAFIAIQRISGWLIFTGMCIGTIIATVLLVSDLTG